MNHKLISNIIIMSALLLSAQAMADRTVFAAVPCAPYQDSTLHTSIIVTLSNPSAQSQTVEVEFTASGDFQLDLSGSAYGKNLITCSVDKKRCSLMTSAQTIAAGENKQMGIYVTRSTGSSNYAVNNGVSVKINLPADASDVEQPGFILASGMSLNETYNGVAYFGGSFTINGGSPF